MQACRKINRAAALILAAVLLGGCGIFGWSKEAEAEKHERQVFAMDTIMTLTAYGAHGEEALDKAEEEIVRLDQLFSISSAEGEVAILNENGSEILSGDMATLLEYSIKMYEETQGIFDITILPLMEEWGFTDGDYKVPSKKTISRLLKKVDASKIEYDKESGQAVLPAGMRIDFGGIAKGYTSARVVEIFKDCGVDSGIISLGGNVQTCGTRLDGELWRVGVQNPSTDAEEPYIGVLECGECAVITSGGYERYFEENGKTYHHIIDPGTGYPSESGLASVTVVSKDGTLADALSTSLFIMGKEKAVSFWKERRDDFDMVLLEEGGGLFITEGLEKFFNSDVDYEIVR